MKHTTSVLTISMIALLTIETAMAQDQLRVTGNLGWRSELRSSRRFAEVTRRIEDLLRDSYPIKLTQQLEKRNRFANRPLDEDKQLRGIYFSRFPESGVLDTTKTADELMPSQVAVAYSAPGQPPIYRVLKLRGSRFEPTWESTGSGAAGFVSIPIVEDINNNGKPELIFMNATGSSDLHTFVDVYTWDGNNAEMVSPSGTDKSDYIVGTDIKITDLDGDAVKEIVADYHQKFGHVWTRRIYGWDGVKYKLSKTEPLK